MQGPLRTEAGGYPVCRRGPTLVRPGALHQIDLVGPRHLEGAVPFYALTRSTWVAGVLARWVEASNRGLALQDPCHPPTYRSGSRADTRTAWSSAGPATLPRRALRL